MKPVDIEDATVIVVTSKGTWVFANVRADMTTDPVFDGSHGHGVAPSPVSYDLTIEGGCDFYSWTAASRAAVQQGIQDADARSPTGQKDD